MPRRLRDQRLRDLIDPDGFLADANRAHDQRYLQVSPSLDGIVFIEGRLDPVGGATLQTALNALSRPIPGDPRTAQQRRADNNPGAIAARHGPRAAWPQNSNAAELPCTWAARCAPWLGSASAASLPWGDAGELAWAGVVPHATVHRLACDATLTVVPLDDEGEPIDAGRATRVIAPSLRRALQARDGGCRFPQCDRPIEWTDGHHLKHWAEEERPRAQSRPLVRIPPPPRP